MLKIVVGATAGNKNRWRQLVLCVNAISYECKGIVSERVDVADDEVDFDAIVEEVTSVIPALCFADRVSDVLQDLLKEVEEFIFIID